MQLPGKDYQVVAKESAGRNENRLGAGRDCPRGELLGQPKIEVSAQIVDRQTEIEDPAKIGNRGELNGDLAQHEIIQTAQLNFRSDVSHDLAKRYFWSQRQIQRWPNLLRAEEITATVVAT